MDTDNERMVGLETKVAFQERTIQQLNEQMYQQQRQIDRLNRVVTDLSSKLTAALTDVGIDDSSTASNSNLDADVPPHY